MKILSLEDDPTTAKTLKIMLTHAGMDVFQVDLGEDAIELAKTYDYDLLLFDMDLPDMKGYEALREIRAAGVHTPAMALTGNDSTETKLKFYGFGGDDFLSKPFHREELIARIRAHVRRYRGQMIEEIITGDMCVNLRTQKVEINGSAVHLTSREYKILELMSQNKGRTLTKEVIRGHIYKGEEEPELKLIDVFICKLRKKLAAAGGQGEYIQTIWGRGYSMTDPEDIEAPA